MSQPLRVENPRMTSHISSRTINSRLWFLSNKELETQILAFLAKYQEKYSVILYAFVLMGNHYHLEALFPKGNRSSFMRSFNSMVARLTASLQENFEGGPLLGRRYAAQALPLHWDIEDKFLYTALNPVSSGLVSKLGDYPLYNSCFDAIRGKVRQFTLVDWRTYRDKARFNKDLQPKDFEHTYTLTFSRLPGYEELSDKKYEAMMRSKIEKRRKELIEQRKNENKGFLGRAKLLKMKVGSAPRSTKKSGRRPLVLTHCKETRDSFLKDYFKIRELYSDCVELLKEGVSNVLFPVGTYPPPLLVPVAQE